MDVELPQVTRILIAVVGFFEAYYVHVTLIFIGAIVLLAGLRKRSWKVRRGMDFLLLKVPLTKSIVSASNLAYISECFAMFFNAGIDILQCLRVLKESMGNEIYQEKLAEVGKTVALADGIASGFRQAVIFSSFVVRMISVGENSGTLSEQLTYIAEQYQRKLCIIVATIGKAIEPLIIVVAGGIFAVIIIGLFLPIYDLVSKVYGI